MPRNAQDVENYLLALNRNYEGSEGSFVVSAGADAPPIALMVDDTIVAVRVDIGKLPSDPTRQNALFRQLLRYNASDLVHASYALEENDEIVLSAGLVLDNLDQNELAGVLSDIDIALARHVAKLRQLATA